MQRNALRYIRERHVEGLSRDEACARYRDKVGYIARRVYERLAPDATVTLDDLRSCGTIGLLEAYDRFEAGRGIKFSTFAEYRIKGAMYDALRSQDAFSRRRRQLHRRMAATVDDLRARFGREPQPAEIADALEMSLDEYWAAQDRVSAITHVSIDGKDGGDEDGRPLLERIADRSETAADQRIAVTQMRQLLKAAIKELPDRERQSVLMYYGSELTLAEIAAVYEVSISRVSQILSGARGRLRKKLSPHISAQDLQLVEKRR